MKTWIVAAFFFILMSLGQIAVAKDKTGEKLTIKMNNVINYVNNNEMPKAWATTVEIANIVKKDPKYDDGAYAEGMNEIVTRLLLNPWKYAQPFLIGHKRSKTFYIFILNHITELTAPEDLNNMKKNIEKNCNLKKYSICGDLVKKIDGSLGAQVKK